MQVIISKQSMAYIYLKARLRIQKVSQSRSADLGSDPPPSPYNHIHYDLKENTDPRSADLLRDTL
jgi:hypothetical protein